MHYTVVGKNYIADEGYVFEHMETKAIYKKMRMGKNDGIENYNVIVEPVSEEEEENNDTGCDL